MCFTYKNKSEKETRYMLSSESGLIVAQDIPIQDTPCVLGESWFLLDCFKTKQKTLRYSGRLGVAFFVVCL